MPQFVLVHDGLPIALPEGEILLGRGLACDIRFNDPAVSREHLRLVVLPGHAAVANLSARGTTINGEKLGAPRRLLEGDIVRFGYQQVRVLVVDQPIPVELRPAGPRIAETDARRITGQVEIVDGPAAVGVRTVASRLAEIVIDMCPRCRAHLPETDDECAACGYAWPAGHPSARTREVPIPVDGDRREPRYRLSLPVIYASATLTVHATVRDLSRGGMFIETEVLDPVGTPCEVSALPDGYAALRLSGFVAHVAGQPTLEHRCGMGIQITGGAAASRDWLERTVALLARATRGSP